ERAEHFPILYVEPLAGNERAFGYDVKTAVTGPFIERVRYSGELAVTTQFQLVQSRRGIVLVYPIFARATNGASEKRCTGVVQVVFRVDEMLAQSELRSPSDSTETLFVDDTAAEPEARLLHYDARAASPGHEFPVSEAAFRSGLTREFAMEFGGRRWLALYRPSKRWIEEQRTWYPELWLASGLSITALIAGLVFVLARRAAAIERLVADRTAELEESRRQLDSLLHSLPGMAFRSRFDDTVTLLFVSEGALPLTGRPASDFIQGAVHFRDVIHPEDLPRVRAATQAALHNRAEFEFEYRIRTFDGREKWVLTRGHGVYSADGTAEFFEGLAIDVTARKQAELEKLALERKLLESQKLESLGLLAGGIAHDFNNLLTGIMGNASLARHRPDVTSEIADHLRKIEAGAARAAELCQQMLAYSGRGRFLVENVELGQLVRDTLPLLRGSLSPRARLELALSEEPTVVTGDATQLRQIVMNLILNAGEALGGAGGEIVVATGRHWIDREFLAAARVGDSLPPGEYVTLEVRDNGCGMSADTLTKIFDPFFTTKFTGRGLGLAAVLGIVRGHSGALKVRSAVGLGTTFTLVLPPGAAAPVARRTAESATPWRAKGKVLIVDDEAPVREVAAQLVATFGFTVVTAADGPAALAEFGRDPAGFDLVFLDLTMPGMDGEETLA
ncbi:MAG TPA: ATP-binding protein, partial [Opitutus sp.]|nr:ATP-binding protein [Opitutus sp.]